MQGHVLVCVMTPAFEMREREGDRHESKVEQGRWVECQATRASLMDGTLRSAVAAKGSDGVLRPSLCTQDAMHTRLSAHCNRAAQVGSQMEPADSESLDQRIYGLGAWLPPATVEPLPTLDEQPRTAHGLEGTMRVYA